MMKWIWAELPPNVRVSEAQEAITSKRLLILTPKDIDHFGLYLVREDYATRVARILWAVNRTNDTCDVIMRNMLAGM